MAVPQGSRPRQVAFLGLEGQTGEFISTPPQVLAIDAGFGVGDTGLSEVVPVSRLPGRDPERTPQRVPSVFGMIRWAGNSSTAIFTSAGTTKSRTGIRAMLRYYPEEGQGRPGAQPHCAPGAFPGHSGRLCYVIDDAIVNVHTGLRKGLRFEEPGDILRRFHDLGGIVNDQLSRNYRLSYRIYRSPPGHPAIPRSCSTISSGSSG